MSPHTPLVIDPNLVMQRQRDGDRPAYDASAYRRDRQDHQQDSPRYFDQRDHRDRRDERSQSIHPTHRDRYDYRGYRDDREYRDDRDDREARHGHDQRGRRDEPHQRDQYRRDSRSRSPTRASRGYDHNNRSRRSATADDDLFHPINSTYDPDPYGHDSMVSVHAFQEYQASNEARFSALRDEFRQQHTAAAVSSNTAQVPKGPHGLNNNDDWNTVKSQVHIAVKFLHGGTLPTPDAPGDDEPNECLVEHDGTPASARICWKPIYKATHPHNSTCIETILTYITSNNRVRLDGYEGKSATVSSAIRESITQYFNNCRRPFLSRAGDEAESEVVPDRRSFFRSRKKQQGLCVQVRRPVDVNYRKPRWAILAELHSAITVVDVIKDGDTVSAWGKEIWMSEKAKKALQDILAIRPYKGNKPPNVKGMTWTAPIDSPDAQRFEDPIWPASKAPIECRLQKWQFTEEWLELNGDDYKDNIVPTDVPLSFAAVRKLQWYKDLEGDADSSSDVSSDGDSEVDGEADAP